MGASKGVKMGAVALVIAIAIVAALFFLKSPVSNEQIPAVPQKEEIKAESQAVQEISQEKIVRTVSENQINFESGKTAVAEIKFSSLETEISGVSARLFKPKNPAFKSQILAVQEANFSEAEITLGKSGNVDAIFYCENFDLENESCYKQWEKTEIPFTQTENSVSFKVSHFSAYVAGTNTSLRIYSYSRPANVQITFYANYSNTSNNWQINDSFANLTINFSDAVSANMTFNASSNLWEYNRSFSSDGTYYYTVHTYSSYENLNVTDSIEVFNCTVLQDNLYINEDTVLCSGDYNLTDNSPSGIVMINSSNVLLDCSGANIRHIGQFTSVEGKNNIEIKNCVFYLGNNLNPGSGTMYFYHGSNVTITNITSGSTLRIVNFTNILVRNSALKSDDYYQYSCLQIEDSINITVQNSFLKGPPYANNPALEIRKGFYLVSPSGIKIQNVTFEGVNNGAVGFFIENASDILINGSKTIDYPWGYVTYRMSNVTNVTITDSDLRTVNSPQNKQYNFSNVQNSFFRNSFFSAISVTGSNLEIKNNTFNMAQISSFALNNSMVENNTIITRDGIDQLSINNVSVKNNVFEGNGSGFVKLVWLNSLNSVFVNNIIRDAEQDLFPNYEFWVSAYNSTFENLTIYNLYTGLRFDAGLNNSFAGLDIHDNSGGLFLYGADINVDNSTIAGNFDYDLDLPSASRNATITNSILGPKIISSYAFGTLNATNVSLFGNGSSITYDNFILNKTGLNNTLVFGSNLISFNSSSFPELNKTAIIKFTNLPWSSTPMLFKDGIRCDNDSNVCNNTFYDINTGVLTSQVFSFSNFTTGNASDCFNVTDNLYVNKDIVICSGNFNVTDAGNDGIIIFNKTGVHVTFSTNFIFGSNSGKGIVAENLSDISIFCTSSCVVRNFSEGVYINNVSGSNLTELDSAFNSKGYAIYNSTNTNLSGIIQLQHNDKGLFVEGGSNNTFYVHYFDQNIIGIQVTSSNSAFFGMDNWNSGGFLVSDSANIMIQPRSSYYESNSSFVVNSTNFTIDFVSYGGLRSNLSIINSSSLNVSSSAGVLSAGEIKMINSENLHLSFYGVTDSSFSAINSSGASILVYNKWYGPKTAVYAINSSGISADGITFQDIDNGINASNSQIELTNLVFINSPAPVVGERILPGSVMSGINVTGTVQYAISARNSSFLLQDSTFSMPIFLGEGVDVSASNVVFTSQNATMAFNGVQINDTVNTSSGMYLLYNLSGIDPLINPGLNKAARITFRYLPWPSTPFINKDGVRCDNTSECTVVSYLSGTLVFDVLGFSNYSSSSSTLPGTPDLDPPTPPVVYDGLNFIDYDWTNNATALKASWNGSFDRSNIFYSYRIMDANGSCYNDECTFKFVGSAQQITVSNLSLAYCQNYTFEVQAEDTAYNTANVSKSDGITVDVSPPVMSSLSSPTHPTPSVAYSSSTAVFTWNASDSFYGSCPSGIAGYSYVLDQDAYTYPDSIIDTNATNVTLADVPNGIWNFHIIPIDYAGNLGSASILQVIVNSTEATIKLNPAETPTLNSNLTITGQIAQNVSDRLLIYNNNVNVKNVTISPTQTLFNFTMNLDMGINAIYANAALNGSSVGKSNTIYIRRVNETRVNATGFTVSYTGGSLTDTSASNLLSSSSTNALFGIGKSSDRLFLFVTKLDADVATRSKYAINNTLFDQINPSIGYPFEMEQNVISTILNYQDIVLSGNDSVQSGRYSLVITNNGTVDGKTQILVRIV